MLSAKHRECYQIHGPFLENYSLKKHNTWGLTGCAKYMYWPSDVGECVRFYRWLSHHHPNVPTYWLGLGSNVWIPDEGLPGVVVCSQKGLRDLSQVRGLIRAEAGVTCAKLAKYAHRLGYRSADFFAGIPGTVGGALRMNAGAFGGETWPWVECVEVLSPSGEVSTQAASDFSWGYRSLQGLADGHYFLAAHFGFAKEATADALSIQTLLARRQETQPMGTRNCGSVFRNPPEDHAARLIEASGLKGLSREGWQISPKHANFIINLGEGHSDALYALIRWIQQQVYEAQGVALALEVCLLGVHDVG